MNAQMQPEVEMKTIDEPDVLDALSALAGTIEELGEEANAKVLDRDSIRFLHGIADAQAADLGEAIRRREKQARTAPSRAVTLRAYADAVQDLVPVALTDTGGGRAAAQVLLSAYNGYDFHLDVTDLCVLDGAHLQAALTVMAGRAQLSTEPHRLIADGEGIFGRIWARWAHLHVSNRYAER